MTSELLRILSTTSSVRFYGISALLGRYIEVLVFAGSYFIFAAIFAHIIVVASLSFSDFEVAILPTIAAILGTLLAITRHACLPLLVEEILLTALEECGIGIRYSRAQIPAVEVSSASGLVGDKLVPEGQLLGATNVIRHWMVFADDILLGHAAASGHIEIFSSFTGVGHQLGVLVTAEVFVTVVLVTEWHVHRRNIAQLEGGYADGVLRIDTCTRNLVKVLANRAGSRGHRFRSFAQVPMGAIDGISNVTLGF